MVDKQEKNKQFCEETSHPVHKQVEKDKEGKCEEISSKKGVGIGFLFCYRLR